MTATSSYQQSVTKMLAIFIVSSVGLLVLNDLVFLDLFTGSLVRDQTEFTKNADLEELRSTLNLTVDQRAEIVVSGQMDRIRQTVHNETTNLRGLIYREKEILSKQIEDKTGEVRGEIAGENSKLTEEMHSEYAELKMELEGIRKEFGEQLITLRKDLEAIQNTSDSKDESIEELKQKLKQIDVNKNETEFVFEINDVEAFLNDEKQSNRRISEFFQCRGISWYVEVRSRIVGQEGHLGISLVPHNLEDDHDWSIRTSYSIGFIAKGVGWNLGFGTTFSKEVQQSFKYFSIVILKDFHLISDDSISVVVKLKADKLIRKSVI